MNDIAGTSPNKHNASVWERPLTGPDPKLSNRTAQDIELWWSLIDCVIETARVNSWTKSEVARRIGMAEGTFSQWFSGKYNGRLDNQNVQVKQWLDALEETASLVATIPVSPSFLKTRASNEIHETLAWAQMTTDLVVITYGAGFGKTAACRQYRDSRPHVFMATMSPHTKTVHGMLNELAAELDVQVFNPARLARAIGQRLQRSGGTPLLIIDEAQNLCDDAINQLRHYVDVFGCGIALVGNSEIYGRYAKKADKNGPSYAQLKSRYGKRLRRENPIQEDLMTFIDAWGVTNPDMVKFLLGVGMKGGALRQIDKTMKLASMYALGEDKPLSLEYLQGAWRNRDVEDMA
ncbi:AAA family ATPase [Ochrobactrum sp. MR28]|nr:AAA family ATPase [Ochrobactrum sp. MR28]MBX8814771.1 AAA family ATPase [Ochrobactrum sp. MR31]